MTRMLASVSTLEDAEIAVAGGADIIDLKDSDVIRATAAAIGRDRMVSAGVVDAPVQPAVVAARVREIAAAGVNYVKVGMFSPDNATACVDELADVAAHVKLIGVFFLDRPTDLSLLPLLGRGGFAGAMIDAKAGTSGRLLDHFSISGLLGFVERCHAAGLLAGLAGALETPDIPRLLVLAPDLLGFNEALRGSDGRTEAVDLARVRAVRRLIPPEYPVAGINDQDLFAARGHGPAVYDDLPVDIVFVEDLVLPAFVGAYAREREAPQNVRFAVAASVVRTGRTAEGMCDVFSYDLITDGIRMLIGSGHVALVETLAERIAAMVLGHPRVVKVSVRVEKLETGSGIVGVEIERTRSALRSLNGLT